MTVILEETLWHVVFLSDKGFGGGHGRPSIRGGQNGKDRTLLISLPTHLSAVMIKGLSSALHLKSTFAINNVWL